MMMINDDDNFFLLLVRSGDLAVVGLLLSRSSDINCFQVGTGSFW